MLTALLFAALLQPGQTIPPTTLACANIVTAEAPTLKSSLGIEAILKVDAEDDHGKNTHLCQSSYTLMLSTKSPAQPFEVFAADDAWGRSMAFRLEGFTQDQGRIFGMISEGGKPPTVEIFAFHVEDGTDDVAELISAFRKRLNATCLASLRVIGTTKEGMIVLSSETSSACSVKGRWQLRVPSDGAASHARDRHHPMRPRAQPILQGTVVIPLDRATTVAYTPRPQPSSR